MYSSTDYCHQRKNKYWFAIILLFVITVFCRICYINNNYRHPDEIITANVIKYMNQSGDYDTNWIKADLPLKFKYDQYNFSSYIYSVYLFTKLVGVSNPLIYRLFSVICSSMILVVLVLFANKTKHTHVFLYSAFITAIAPILIQDAHYARPEAFVSILTLFIIYLCWPCKKNQYYSSYLAAILIGFLVACKISMLFFVWLPFLPTFSYALDTKQRISTKKVLVFTCIVLSLTILGFLIGVPGAFRHPHVYLNGIKTLLHQYDGIHPGHGHLSGGPVADLLVGYLGATFGWAIAVFFVVGCLSKFKEHSWRTIVLVYFPPVFYIGYFACKSVFFERNLSHIIPLYIIGSAYGIQVCYAKINQFLQKVVYSKALLLFILLFTSINPIYYSYMLVFDVFSGKDDGLRRNYYRHIINKYKPRRVIGGYISNHQPFRNIDSAVKKGYVPLCFHASDLGDDMTKHYLNKLYDEYEIRSVGSYESLFKNIPPCTLHAYHSWTDRYFLIYGFR